MFFMNLTVIHSTVLGVLLSLTLGMLIYILFDELYPRICHSKNKKINYLGIFLGVVILFISLFL